MTKIIFYLWCFPERSVRSITIKTGDKAGAGTDLDVKAKICDGQTNCCETPYPLKTQGDDKEQKDEDVYTLPAQLGPCGVVSIIYSWYGDHNCWDYIFNSCEIEFIVDLHFVWNCIFITFWVTSKNKHIFLDSPKILFLNEGFPKGGMGGWSAIREKFLHNPVSSGTSVTVCKYAHSV